ncbi:MAG: PocR ligand-binding domain-containing protein [Porcipelethomonas sp.]
MQEYLLTKLIDVDFLQKIQNAFSKCTGMSALSTDINGVPVTDGSGFTYFCENLIRNSEKGCARCKECNKQGVLTALKNGRSSVYRCHAGFVNFAAPIVVEGRFIGSLIGGQIKTGSVDISRAEKTADELGIDRNKYIEALSEIKIKDYREAEKAADYLADIADLISDVAYSNYKAFRHCSRVERIARSHKAFMMNFNSELQNRVQEWLEESEKTVKECSYKELPADELILKGRGILSDIKETVELSKMTEVDFDLVERCYSMRKLTEKISENIKSHFPEKPVDLTYEIRDNVPEKLLGDTGRISQIVIKLILNLLGRLDEGKINLCVSCRKRSYSTITDIRISSEGKYVSDGGNSVMNDITGMDAVHILVKQMSGMFSAESSADEGVVFTVSLPQLEVYK